MARRLPRSAPSSAAEDRFHRFLKPGALARIRDSKIIARSIRSVPLSRLSSPSSPVAAEEQAATTTTTITAESAGLGFHPRFVSHYRVVSGPRYLLRKKLIASRSVYLAPTSPDFSDPFGDVGFGSDLVAAH